MGDPDGFDRREFIKVAGVGAGAALLAGCLPEAGDGGYIWPGPDNRAPSPGAGALHVAVIGAGSWGSWTALHLRQLGARVTLVDTYGPGNSRSTSGGETRGVRSSYGDRAHGPHWCRWAGQAIERWKRWDAEWSEYALPRVFFQTGDLILRPRREDPYLIRTMETWDDQDVAYEVLDTDEIARRWSMFDLTEAGVGVYEPRAGVVRARRAVESVAEAFTRKGGEVVIARALPGSDPERGPGSHSGRTMTSVALSNGDTLSADLFIFALGPWFPKVFPALMGNRLRIPIGHTFYMAIPPGDNRWQWPNMPSYGIPGATGWPALPPDHRGFRIRTGGRSPTDPDESDRWIAEEHHERPRELLATWFPTLADAPIAETRACHYESTTDRNFIVDHHPDYDNVWIAGGGSAESFKFGPWVGEYVARRVTGMETDPDADEGFRLDEEEFQPPAEGDEDDGG